MNSQRETIIKRNYNKVCNYNKKVKLEIVIKKLIIFNKKDIVFLYYIYYKMLILYIEEVINMEELK